MNRLYVVRHANSCWSNKLLSDYERPLKKSGVEDAHQLAQYLKTKKFIPDCILYSAANRTTETAEIIYNVFNEKSIKMINNKSLYGASAQEVCEVITAANNNYDSMMLVGHNPTITMLINQLSDAIIDDVPMAGAAIIDVNTDDLSGKLIEFIYPKKLNLLK